MRRALFLTLLIGALAPQATAQVHSQSRFESWATRTYVRQLGALHYPGGEAGQQDRINAVRALADGAVIVAGFTFGSLGEPSGGNGKSDIFVARFGPSGALDWVTQIGAVTGPLIPALNGDPLGPGGDAGEHDFANDLAVTSDGSIFVTGRTHGNLGETHAGGGDVILARFAASGSLLWLRQLGVETAATIPPEPGATDWGDASNFDTGSSILSHAGGALTIGGGTTSNLSEEADLSGLTDFLLVRYDDSGNLQWVRQMSAVSSPLIGYDPSYGDTLGGIALQRSGEIVLAGSATSIQGTTVAEYPVLMTFDDSGQPQDWNSVGGPTTAYHGIAIDESSGRIYVAGNVFTANDHSILQDAMAACFEADLSLVWYRRLDAASTSHLGLFDLGQDEYVRGIALDAWGNPIFAGVTFGSLNEPNAGGSDLFSAKLRASDGHVAWVSQLGQTTAAAFGLDATGFESLSSRALAIGLGGRILLGGSTTGSFGEPNAGNADALLLRLDPNGKL